jgi:hypothetical protein
LGRLGAPLCQYQDYAENLKQELGGWQFAEMAGLYQSIKARPMNPTEYGQSESEQSFNPTKHNRLRMPGKILDRARRLFADICRERIMPSGRSERVRQSLVENDADCRSLTASV